MCGGSGLGYSVVCLCLHIAEDMPRSEPPHVTRINVNKTGESKQDLTLTCVASGEPAPGMHFYRQSDDGNFYLVLVMYQNTSTH